MTPLVGAAREMRVEIPATLEALELVCAQFRKWVGGTQGDDFCAELLLREAMTNAVVHGCRKDPSKSVRCVMRLRPRHLTIAISDDGPGFDWRAAAKRRAGTADTSGRGIEILHTCASRVHFGSRGNSVVIVRRFHTE